MSTENHTAKCPFSQATGAGTANADWWPDPVSYTHLTLPTILLV